MRKSGVSNVLPWNLSFTENQRNVCCRGALNCNHENECYCFICLLAAFSRLISRHHSVKLLSHDSCSCYMLKISGPIIATKSHICHINVLKTKRSTPAHAGLWFRLTSQMPRSLRGLSDNILRRFNNLPAAVHGPISWCVDRTTTLTAASAARDARIYTCTR